MESKHLLIDPMVISANNDGTKNSLKKIRKYFSNQRSNKDPRISPYLRKNLPQTSNLLSKIKKKKIETPNNLPALKQDSSTSPRYNNEVETIVLKDHKKILVSSTLSELLMKLLTKYPNCPVIKDLYLSKKEIYKYLFDYDLNLVDDIGQISKPPLLVIISCRYKIPEDALERSRAKYEKKVQDRKYSLINLYDSIIDKKTVQYKRRRSPIYVLKYTKSHVQISKPALPKNKSENISKNSIYNRIIPFSQGKKLKEGVGGFKRPPILYSSKKTRDISLTPSLKSLEYNYRCQINTPIYSKGDFLQDF